MAKAEIITMAKKAADAWRNTDTYHQAAQIIDMLVEELEQNPTLTPPNEWVSVEDAAPDPGERVLATDGIFVGEAYRSSANSWFRHTGFPWRDGVTGRTVRFWMSLPAPPGEDNNVPANEPLTLEFDVVDTTTGKYPDWERITIEEPWANRLVDCDMDGIAIREDGSLILLDEYGNCVSCPPYRFEIRRPPKGET